MPGVRYDERGEVAAVQRQFLDGPLFDDRADFRRVRAHERRRRHDRHRLLDAPHLQRDIDPRTLVDLQDDAFADRLLEALHVDFHRVRAGHEKGRRIVAGRIRHVTGSRALVHFPHRDRRAGHDAAGIGDRADDRSRVTWAARGGTAHNERRGEWQCEDAISSSSQILSTAEATRKTAGISEYARRLPPAPGEVKRRVKTWATSPENLCCW